MLCNHVNFYHCEIKVEEESVLFCFQCLINKLLNETSSKLSKINLLRRSMDVLSQSAHFIVINLEKLGEVISELLNFMKKLNYDEEINLINEMILFLLNHNKDPAIVLGSYLRRSLTEINLESSNENDRCSYFKFLKYISINMQKDFLRCLVIEKGICLKILSSGLSESNNEIRGTAAFIINVAIDQENSLLQFLNLNDVATALNKTLGNEDIHQEDAVISNFIVLLIILLEKSNNFLKIFVDMDQSPLIIRKLLLLQDSNTRKYQRYGLMILDLILTCELHKESMLKYFTNSSNISEYLFDLLLTDKDILLLVIKCLSSFLECQMFCETSYCAYGLMNVLRCIRINEDGHLSDKIINIILKLLNDIMLSYNGHVGLFLNESVATFFLSLTKSLLEKRVKSTYLLSCQALTLFLSRHVSVRPFPYLGLIDCLKTLDSINLNSFHSSSTRKSNESTSNSKSTKNRCIFVNLHVDLIYEIIRFCDLDRSNVVLCEDLKKSLLIIRNLVDSLFFSTYLRYTMGLLRSLPSLNELSIDKFVDVVMSVLSNIHSSAATKSSFILIFPQLLSALFTLSEYCKSESFIREYTRITDIIVTLIHDCTMVFDDDTSDWRCSISQGIYAIKDINTEALIETCLMERSSSSEVVTSLWLLSTNDSLTEGKDLSSLLTEVERICNQRMLSILLNSPLAFTLQFLTFVKKVVESSLNGYNNMCDFISNLYLLLNTRLSTNHCSYLTFNIGLLKLINDTSSVCMKASQTLLLRSFTNKLEVSEDSWSLMINGSLTDFINLVVTCFDTILLEDDLLPKSLDSGITFMVNKLQNEECESVADEDCLQSMIDFFKSFPDRLPKVDLLQYEDRRMILWRLVRAVLIFPVVFSETMSLLKITTFIANYLKNDVTDEKELILICDILVRMCLYDVTNNVIRQLSSTILSDTSSFLELLKDNEECGIIHNKIILLTVLISHKTCSISPKQRVEFVFISGRILLQCLDYSSKIRTSATTLCALYLLYNNLSVGLVKTTEPSLVSHNGLLETVALLYSLILDNTTIISRTMAIEVLGMIISFCYSREDFISIGDQVMSSVWHDIIIQHLLGESSLLEDTAHLYSASCLRYLSKLLECKSSTINLAISSSHWRGFCIWFVQHQIKDLPSEIGEFVPSLVVKISNHGHLSYLSEIEKICLVKKLASEHESRGLTQEPGDLDSVNIVAYLRNMLNVK